MDERPILPYDGELVQLEHCQEKKDKKSKYTYEYKALLNNTASSDEFFIIENGVLKKYIGNRKIAIIPRNVHTIASNAFDSAYCQEYLEEVEISFSVKNIESRAFVNCRNLKALTIPMTVESIAEDSFVGTFLYGIYIENGPLKMTIDRIDKYVRFNQLLKYIPTRNKCEICFGGKYGIGFKITGVSGAIDAGAYVPPNEVEFLVIPEQITIIESGFKQFVNLKTVVLHDKVEKIGRCAFYKCKSLEYITLPDSVTEIGSYAFWQCDNLKELVIPKGVRKIGRNAIILPAANIKLLSSELLICEKSIWCNSLSCMSNIHISCDLSRDTEDPYNEYSIYNPSQIDPLPIDFGFIHIGALVFKEGMKFVDVPLIIEFYELRIPRSTKKITAIQPPIAIAENGTKGVGVCTINYAVKSKSHAVIPNSLEYIDSRLCFSSVDVIDTTEKLSEKDKKKVHKRFCKLLYQVNKEVAEQYAKAHHLLIFSWR